MEILGNLIISLIYGVPAYLILKYIFKVQITQNRLAKVYGIDSKGMTPNQFLSYRAHQMSNRTDKSFNREGVYIFYNETNKMFYIGQGIHVHDRVSDHINGRGNGDLYADMKYGHKFRVNIIMLNESMTLNTLERELIGEIGKHNKLYNKTRGNRG